ncbi:MAG: sulfite exporter TauE/SafE family protein [Chitinispirillaceae bacterium]
MIITLFSLGLVGGFLAGLLGLGGALVMIPLMLTVPPVLGFEPLNMKAVSGLSMLQVFFSSLSGLIIHRKNNYVHGKLLLLIGVPLSLFAFLGAYATRYVNDMILLVLFEVLIVVALFPLIISPKKRTEDEARQDLHIYPARSIISGMSVGMVSGMVGAGGGFILIPLLITFLHIPLKITIGTSLGIVFLGSIMGALGKILSLQIELTHALPLIIGSILSARLGAKTSHKLPSHVLRYILIGVVIFSGVQVLLRLTG